MSAPDEVREILRVMVARAVRRERPTAPELAIARTVLQRADDAASTCPVRLARLTLALPAVKKALYNYEHNKFADCDARDAGLAALEVMEGLK